MKKEEVIKLFVGKGYLISPDFINNINENEDYVNFLDKLSKLKNKPTIINNDVFLVLSKTDNININWSDFDSSKAYFESGKNDSNYGVFLDVMGYNISEEKREILNNLAEELKNPDIDIGEEKYENEESVIILKNYSEIISKKEVRGFVDSFRKRYDIIKKILIERAEFNEAISIRNLTSKENNSFISFIGLILKKDYTKNNNIILTIEDLTGQIKAIINKEREVYSFAEDLVEDEVIGVSGVFSKGVVFVNNITLPDIPNTFELKKSPEDIYIAFIGDLHFGLKKFMGGCFDNFLKWLNKDYGDSKEKEIVEKLKYLFIAGDVVEGVGIYPEQDKDLEIKDIYKQYELVAEYLGKIPKNIKIVMCGGNHDAMRISEPQPIFDKKFSASLHKIKNLTLVSNPGLINIHASKDFPGFNILLYHGFSFPYYADNVKSIKSKGGILRPDLIMEFLLKRRNLAPTYASSLVDPLMVEHLIIDKVPDFFCSGHIHRVSVSQYKNITCINSSCWVTQTRDMERRGIIPDPAKIIVVNLKTREHKILNFEENVR